MATISVSNIQNGNSLDASVVSGNFSTIVNEINGNLDNNNIKAAAGIDFTKLASAAWSAWSPTLAGFSANPSLTTRWQQIGKWATLMIAESSAGTSNAGTFTLTLPFTPKSTQTIGGVRIKDNGGYSLTQGAITFTAGNTTASIFRDMQGTAFTSSGGKACDLAVTVEVQ